MHKRMIAWRLYKISGILYEISLFTHWSDGAQCQKRLVLQIRIFLIEVQVIGIAVVCFAWTPVISKRIFSINAVVAFSPCARQEDALAWRTSYLATHYTFVCNPTPAAYVYKFFKLLACRCLVFTIRLFIGGIIFYFVPAISESAGMPFTEWPSEP